MSELLLTETNPGQFSIRGELNRHTIPRADSLRLVSQNQSLSSVLKIDMADVTHVDTAALAWLINVLKYAHSQDARVQLKNIPQTLLNLAKISDVDSFLSVQ